MSDRPGPPAAPRTVTVTVTGRASAPPDVLLLELAAEGRAREVTGALDTAGRSLAAMVTRLRHAGLSDRELRTSGASLWSRTDEQGRVVGYVATQRLTATLHEPAAAGDLVADVIAAGGPAARLDGLRFVLADDAAVLQAARDNAWNRARAAAGHHATRAGRALGAVVRVREAADGGAPPMALARAAAETVPVESGVHEVTVVLEVEWELA